MKELALRIDKFIEKYAVKNPNYEDENDNLYTSPDAAQLAYSSELLHKRIIPQRCFSEWGSGGYKPYTDKEGCKEHNYLVTEVYKLINSKERNMLLEKFNKK